jgi:hypothetical protein
VKALLQFLVCALACANYQCAYTCALIAFLVGETLLYKYQKPA